MCAGGAAESPGAGHRGGLGRLKRLMRLHRSWSKGAISSPPASPKQAEKPSSPTASEKVWEVCRASLPRPLRRREASHQSAPPQHLVREPLQNLGVADEGLVRPLSHSEKPQFQAAIGKGVRLYGRCLRFNLLKTTYHEVVPYSEIYGLHPKEFNFDRDMCMVPTMLRQKQLEWEPMEDCEDGPVSRRRRAPPPLQQGLLLSRCEEESAEPEVLAAAAAAAADAASRRAERAERAREGMALRAGWDMSSPQGACSASCDVRSSCRRRVSLLEALFPGETLSEDTDDDETEDDEDGLATDGSSSQNWSDGPWKTIVLRAC